MTPVFKLLQTSTPFKIGIDRVPPSKPTPMNIYASLYKPYNIYHHAIFSYCAANVNMIISIYLWWRATPSCTSSCITVWKPGTSDLPFLHRTPSHPLSQSPLHVPLTGSQVSCMQLPHVWTQSWPYVPGLQAKVSINKCQRLIGNSRSFVSFSILHI